MAGKKKQCLTCRREFRELAGYPRDYCSVGCERQLPLVSYEQEDSESSDEGSGEDQ